MRCQSLASRPWLACGPTGWSASAPSCESWNPTAVSPSCAIGDWTLRLPIVPSTSGSGCTDVIGAAAATVVAAVAGGATVVPESLRGALRARARRRRPPVRSSAPVPAPAADGLEAARHAASAVSPSPSPGP